MIEEYPRQPTPDEFAAIYNLCGDAMYGNPAENREEYHDLNVMLREAADNARFFITYGSSDTPGYWGPMAFVIWPDTSVTMYRFASMNLPSFAIKRGDWYETDKDGMPWITQ